MEIRLLSIEDYNEIYELWSNTEGVGVGAYDTYEHIERYLKRNPNTCFAAVANNEIIGVILGGHDGARGFIRHMAVKEEYQKKGIGKMLLDETIKALKKEGISKIALVTFKNNEKGNTFWSKMGFTFREDLYYRDIIIENSKS